MPPASTNDELSATPLAIARCLAREPGVFSLFDGERGVVFVGCRPVASSRELDPEPELTLDESKARFPRWVGLLPYEAFRKGERRRWVRPERRFDSDERPTPHLMRPIWCRYEACLELEVDDSASDPLRAPVRSTRVRADRPESGVVLGELLKKALSKQSRRTTGQTSLDWRPADESPAVHEERIREALRHIDAGDLYQVNLARRFEFDAYGGAIELLDALGPRGHAAYSAALEFDLSERTSGEPEHLGVVSLSPELCLELHASGRLRTQPIKGTRPRASDPAEDLRLRTELDISDKERAELAMVIDVERNDLGRVAESGSVRLTRAPHVVSHPTVHHRVAEVQAQLRAGVTRTELFDAFLPSGSVTGAPKLRAMEWIAELESRRRGLYTGALGAIHHDGSVHLSMAIRVLTIAGGAASSGPVRAHYFAGGGIVADSDPAAEVTETVWKARALGSLTGELSAESATKDD